ncbi:MAG: hypothetical protein H6732_15805 [Alphaproteobacteria bacterium]|nr:hypothetical protein [Alphaproteobacteria bacterium]
MADTPPDVEVRGIGETVRLLTWLLLVGVAPVWVLLTVSLAQIGAGQRVILEDGEGGELVVQTQGLGMVGAGLTAAGWILAIAAVVLPLALLLDALRRRRLAAQVTVGDVLPDALVAGATWQVERHRVAAEDAPPPIPAPSTTPPSALPAVAPPPAPPADPGEGAPTDPGTDPDLDALFGGPPPSREEP